jgi:hypothetical protein
MISIRVPVLFFRLIFQCGKLNVAEGATLFAADKSSSCPVDIF